MSLGSGQGKTQPVQFLHHCSLVFWVRGLSTSLPLVLTSEGPSGLRDLTSGPSLRLALDLTITGVSSLEPSWSPRLSAPFLHFYLDTPESSVCSSPHLDSGSGSLALYPAHPSLRSHPLHLG